MLKEVQRDQGLTVLLLVSAAALLFLVVRDFSGELPQAPTASTNTTSGFTAPQVRLPGDLFAASRVPTLAVPTNQVGSFRTTYFQPRPKPTPPPPTTRKVDLIYRGFLEAGGRPRQAVVEVGDKQILATLSSNVVANLFVSGVELRTLTLTNAAGLTNVLFFNVKTNLEVPLP